MYCSPYTPGYLLMAHNEKWKKLTKRIHLNRSERETWGTYAINETIRPQEKIHSFYSMREYMIVRIPLSYGWNTEMRRWVLAEQRRSRKKNCSSFNGTKHDAEEPTWQPRTIIFPILRLSSARRVPIFCSTPQTLNLPCISCRVTTNSSTWN